MKKLTKSDVALDKRLSSNIDRDTVALGKLRYDWCVTEGLTYAEYGQAVGRHCSSIATSVRRYAHQHNLSVVSAAVRSRESQAAGRPTAGSRQRREITTAWLESRGRRDEVKAVVTRREKLAVERFAKAEGMSVAEVVREAVNAYIEAASGAIRAA